MSKVVMIHGRPSGHPLHRKYGESVNADFLPVDFILRWHDKNYSPFRRYLSWFLCALFFPKKNKYDYFLCEGPHFMIGLMKALHLIRKNQKIVVLLDDETLYFLFAKQYSKRTTKAFIALLKYFDAIICVGKMETSLAQNILRKECPPLYTTFNGINNERLIKLNQAKPNLESQNIIFIGNVLSGWRSWYKGIDILLQTFEKIHSLYPQATLKLVGYIDQNYFRDLIEKYCSKSKNKIEIIGHSNELEKHLEKCSLYLHIGRGEAWGITITEAMAAGVIPIVSEWTGAKEVVEQVDKNLIVNIDVSSVIEKVDWYFKLSLQDKISLSNRCKEISKKYSEGAAINNFQVVFKKLEHDLKLK